MAVQLLTVTDYARRRGCDEKAVRRAIAENRITAILDAKGRKRIDPAVADIQWAQNTRARADSARAGAASASGQGGGGVASFDAAVAPESGAAGSPAASGDQGYADNRARRERYDADKAQMEAERMAGGLIQRTSTERAIFDSFRALRDSVMAVPKRAAAKVIQMPDARDIEQVLLDELRKAFEGWEERMLDKLPKADGV